MIVRARIETFESSTYLHFTYIFFLSVLGWHLSTFLIEGPGEKKKEKFPRLAKAFLLRVAESNQNFYIFCPKHA